MTSRINLNETYYDKRMKMYYDIFHNYKDEYSKISGHIYIVGCKHNRRKFCGGSEIKPTKTAIMKLIQQKAFKDDLRKYRQPEFTFDIVESKDYSSPLELMIRVDYYKIKYKSVGRGYNDGYCFRDSGRLFNQELQTTSKRVLTRNIKLSFDQDLYNRHYKEKYNYDEMDGYIYKVVNKKTKEVYLGYIDRCVPMNKVMNHFYTVASQHNVKQNKLIKALHKYKYSDFKCSIVRAKGWDNDLNLVRETNALIKEHNTVENGYNNKRAEILKLNYDSE